MSESAAWLAIGGYAEQAIAALEMRDGREARKQLDQIVGLTTQMERQLGSGVHTNPRGLRKNPALAIWANPGVTVAVQMDQELSERAIALSYEHVDDGNDYEHKFAKGVAVRTCLIGERATVRNQVRGVMLYRPDGRNLWDDFEV